jgi:PAS domain S-box-containing protein
MLFERSRNAMLIADDDRRYRDANKAAERLLRKSREELLVCRIDDLTPPEHRAGLDEVWREFLSEGSQAGRFELLLGDGERIEVEFSAVTNVFPGRHLSIFLSPVPELEEHAGDRHSRGPLTPREREVIGLLAMGATTEDVAGRLVIAEETARTHVKNAMEKLGSRNRAQAVAEAIRIGELTL